MAKVEGDAVTFNTTAGNKTVAITPAVDDLLVVVAANTGTTTDPTVTDDRGGTYTRITGCVKNTSADEMHIYVRDKPCQQAVSHTVTMDVGGAGTGGGVWVCLVSGMAKYGANAVRQSAIQSNQAAAGTPTATFAFPINTNNLCVFGVFNATNPAGMTPPASFIERQDVGYNTPASGLEVATRDTGQNGLTLTAGGTSASAFCTLGVELDTATPTASGSGRSHTPGQPHELLRRRLPFPASGELAFVSLTASLGLAYEATAGIAAAAAAPYSAQTIRSGTLALPFEALAARAQNASASAEAQQGIVTSASEPYEAPAGRSAIGLDPWEAFGQITGQRGLAYESLALRALAATAVYEALQGKATSGIEQWEATGGRSSTGQNPWEAFGFRSTLAGLPFEALAARSIAVLQAWEALAARAITGVEPYEGLAGRSSAITVPWEVSGGVVIRTLQVAWEALAARQATSIEPLEALAARALAIIDPYETLRASSPTAAAAWETFRGAAAAAGLPWEGISDAIISGLVLLSTHPDALADLDTREAAATILATFADALAGTSSG